MISSSLTTVPVLPTEVFIPRNPAGVDGSKTNRSRLLPSVWHARRRRPPFVHRSSIILMDDESSIECISYYTPSPTQFMLDQLVHLSPFSAHSHGGGCDIIGQESGHYICPFWMVTLRCSFLSNYVHKGLRDIFLPGKIYSLTMYLAPSDGFWPCSEPN